MRAQSRSWAFTDDLSTWTVVAVAVVAVLSLVLLLLEQRRRERHGAIILVTGILGIVLLAAAVLRPVRVTTRGTMVGPRVVILVDQSRRLLLSAENRTRRQIALLAVERLSRHLSESRLSVLGFGHGAPMPFAPGEALRLGAESDLSAALSQLSSLPGERPQAMVVVSDGRITRPQAGTERAALVRELGALGVPIHTVAVADRAPKDASIRSVRAAGAAVAHQPLALEIEIGCAGGLDCGSIPVTARELRHGVEPAVLASGVAEIEDGVAKLELVITLERAGARVVDIAIDAPEGDVIPDNDRRILSFVVARERIRLLHVAGRPTYDVRALRLWLKSDESVDLVAFFILRTDRDDPGTDDESELALIPFPVDELFTEHLPSFDAIVLQDIDAVTYKLEQHLPALEQYVRSGGGLIMVGGPSSFVGGNYAGTALERVLPVSLSEREKPFDVAEFVPRYTEAGAAAPVLRQLRELFDIELPSMPGSNTLGPARDRSIVLWEHPQRQVDGRSMPVLALAEAGDGRSIALSVDATYELAYGELAGKVGGRGYGALWDGLLGWLMRDPRYEAVRVELVSECISSEPCMLRVVQVPGASGEIELRVEPLGGGGQPIVRRARAPPSGSLEIDVGRLEPGGHTALVRIGAAPPTRFDFACERGGDAWSDSRPDRERLAAIALATGGRAVPADAVEELPLPPATQIAAERHVSALLPPWVWTLCAASALGLHWVARRRGGLA
jgi:uncharacterized membrane protein